MKIITKILVLSFITMNIANLINASELNIYTSRKKDLITPLIEEYTKQTQVKVNIRYGKAPELTNRIQTEASKTSADLVIVPDAGNLYKMQSSNLLQKINLPVLKNIPKELKAIDDSWLALTKRARVIVYNPKKLKDLNITSYLDLAKPKFKNKICIRSSSNVYNQSLIAFFIKKMGEEKTKQWLKGFVSNFSKKPSGNDRAQILYLQQGLCDVTLVNTYYLSLIENAKEGKYKGALEGLKILFPKDELNTHYNISGLGLVKYSKNKENALQFIEFMLSDIAQELYANLNYEFPVIKKIALPPSLKKYPKPNQESLISSFVKHNTKAIFLMDNTGWK